MYLRKTIARAVLLAVAVTPPLASASVIGFLGNFDVINDTGSTANGFEIDLEGLHEYEITDVFGGPGRGFPTGRGFGANSVERYGAPSIVEYGSGASFGTKVTYFGLYSAGAYDYGTPSIAPGQFATPGDNCWSGGGLSYGPNTPCDHFGVGTTRNATKTTYSWLYDNPASPGTLTNANGAVSLPAPVWQVIPAAPVAGQPPAPPVVGAVVQAPAPVQQGEIEPQWGEAIWVKVVTTELPEAVKLEDLIGGNPKVEQAEVETEWQLLQVEPGHPESGQLESGYLAPVGANAASILRRWEFYKFGGEYDAEDHHALLVGSDSHPGEGDVGAYIGAQNAAMNFNVAAAIPEPETYAMLLAGLGLLGLVARRRRSA